MSLTAPIKPTPPTVPQVKLHPVESNSQNTVQTEQPAVQKNLESTAQKPAVTAKPESAVNNTTVINKVEPNNQDKVPLLNMPQKPENSDDSALNTTTVTEKPPTADNKVSGFDFYAAIICLVLFTCMVLYFFWRHKKLDEEPKMHKRQAAKKPKIGSKAAMPRTVIDYSADNTKDIVDMLTGPDDLQPDNTAIKHKIKEKVKSNFEFRV